MLNETLFWSHVKKLGADGCWEWIGARTAYGYGQAWVARPMRTSVMAHRAAWAMERGPIPPGLLVLHSCDNPPCVNPAHLFLGTQSDNMLDSVSKGRHRCSRRAACAKGHPYDQSNTYVSPQNKRDCVICRRARQASYQLRRRTA